MSLAMRNPSEWHRFRDVAIELAQLGGDHALKRLGDAITHRKDDESPVTDADHAVQAVILAQLGRRHPDHATIVEEELSGETRHADPAQTPYCWVIDPIDGTRNFARGLRMFATSVALLFDGRPVAGAIFDASSGSTYSVAAGAGADLDGRPIHVNDRPLGPDTTVAFSSFRRHPVQPGIRRLYESVLFRNCGAACLHQAWIAAGFVDAIYAPDTKLWDIAAGGLLIAEAGGVVTDLAGRSLWPADLNKPHNAPRPILAGTSSVHPVVLSASMT